MKKNKENKIRQGVGLLVVFSIFASWAMISEGKLFGHKFDLSPADEVFIQQENTVKINTTETGKDITGYAGNTPLYIYITDGKIDSVSPLPNEETPGFFKRLAKEGLYDTWKGKTVAEAAEMNVDAISGATFSSKAVIENVQAGCHAYIKRTGEKPAGALNGVKDEWNFKSIAILVIILAGAIIPLFIKDKRYRIIQQILNVAVLGLWGGTFIDYAIMKGSFVNSYSAASFSIHILLFVALFFPIFGQTSHYCNWICPYGSLQELSGRLSKKKIHLGAKTLRFLEIFRLSLWTLLTSFLFIGWGTAWVDYEIFSAFIVESASIAVIVVAVVFLFLSIFINRPFCRFVCPTGSILKILN